jgi:RNA polymerase sigma factor FliA
VASRTTEFIQHEHVEIREVVRACSDMVDRCAQRVQRELGLSDDVLEFADLVQFGYVGLLEARGRFDASRGIDFRWYAQRRIHGAILDGLRKMTRLPRRAHQLLRIAGVAQDDDLQFGDALEAALEAGRQFARSGFLIIQSPYSTESAPDQPSPEQLTHERRLAERIRRLVDELGDPDREIARRHLLEGESLSAIAADLNISRPWAWRVLERACCDLVSAFRSDLC